MFKDKILLITEGTGSFGNAVLNRFLKTQVREIRIFYRDEKKQEDMRILYNDPKFKFYIGDVRQYDSAAAAMAGVPVVCSTAGSLPEVAGEGAVYFDPYSVEDMTDKISWVARDPALRDKMRQKGLANVQRFSWEQTAWETMAVYQQVYETRS